MHHHDHQVGITSTDGRNPRGIGSTQIRVSSEHDELRICEELGPGEHIEVPLDDLAEIKSIALEAREVGKPSNVTPNVEFELGGSAFDFSCGPFSWHTGSHFESPFGPDVTQLLLVNNEPTAVIVRGSILPASVLVDDASDEAAAVGDQLEDDAE